ncbi:MAG: carbohydrate ABC transporter permease [Treponema sp.]|nr:carbohydrate ABC transporter permease [Treponema sp.]
MTAQRRLRKSIRTFWLYFALIAIVAALLFPFLWMILTSLRNQVQNTSAVPVWIFSPTLTNYRSVFEQHHFLAYTWHSFVVAVLATGIGLVIGLPAAYTISRYRQRGLAFAILFARITPYITFLVPWFAAFRFLHMVDTYTALVSTFLIVSLPLIIWLMITFFDDVPIDLEEAAKVDGAGEAEAFFRIVIPLSTPGIVAAAILAFVFSWNQFLFALILSGSNTQTVPVAVFNFITYGEINYGGLAAAAVLITLPVLVLALFIQRWIVQGLTMGAVKG